MMLIGIIGKKQSGKDTLAKIFQDLAASNSFKQIKISRDMLAAPLKRTVCDLMGIDESLVYGENEAKETFTDYYWESLPMDIRVSNATMYFIPKRDILISRDEYLQQPKKNGMKGYPKPREGRMTVREVLQVVGTDIFRSYFSNSIFTKSLSNRLFNGNETGDVIIVTDIRFQDELDGLSKIDNSYFIGLTRSPFNDYHKSEIGIDYNKIKHNLKNRFLLIDNEKMNLDEFRNESEIVWNKIMEDNNV